MMLVRKITNDIGSDNKCLPVLRDDIWSKTIITMNITNTNFQTVDLQFTVYFRAELILRNSSENNYIQLPTKT